LGVLYWGNNSSLSITQAQVEAVIANTPIFEGVVLAFCPCIMKVSPSSDMSVIWIDIWDSQKRTKSKTLINYSFNLDVTQLQFGELLCILELPSIATAGAGDI